MAKTNLLTLNATMESIKVLKIIKVYDNGPPYFFCSSWFKWLLFCIWKFLESCQPKDSDVCLQTSRGRGKNYKCATSTGYCSNWGKDMRRCCPDSCGTGVFLEMHCNAFSGSGTCVYPNQAQCRPDRKLQNIVLL